VTAYTPEPYAELHSVDGERALAGAALLAPALADAILDTIKPDRLLDTASRTVLAAVADLRAAGHDPDVAAVAERCRLAGTLEDVGGIQGIDSLTAHAPAVGAIRSVIASVSELIRWRERLAATFEAQVAIQGRDGDDWDAALRRIEETEIDSRAGGGWHSPTDVGLQLLDALEAKDRVRYPWPFHTLNNLSGGGARRGQLTGVFGPVSHGKSVVVDMALHSMGEGGANVALFVNEMTVDERAERLAARLARVQFSRIQQATSGLLQLSADEGQAIIKAMASQPVAMVGAADWSARDITREARRRRLDVVAIDIVQGLPHESGRKRNETLEAAVQHLDAFAKDTGCHVILVGHINRSRVGADGTWPLPGLGDVRDCAELVNRPDNVLFVWRAQDPETLNPTDDGLLRVAKYRGARLTAFPISLRGEYQLFYENPMATTATTAAS
jgi:replicative DNA helicase